jgi:hypothetical protein
MFIDEVLWGLSPYNGESLEPLDQVLCQVLLIRGDSLRQGCVCVLKTRNLPIVFPGIRQKHAADQGE